MNLFYRTRVIPVLLLQGAGLVKTIKYKTPRYIGDPINSVRIFNEKEVDEIIFLDISASVERRGPNFDLLRNISEEAFMPMAYGGGINSLDEIKNLFRIGFEKVILNSCCYGNSKLIREAADIFGSQSVVVSVDVKRNVFGQLKLFSHSGTKKQCIDLVSHCCEMERRGAGEIMINSMDLDGTKLGYDLKALKKVSDQISIPVVANGGAGSINDFREAVEIGGASAVAAGSLFVFVGKHDAVLINYPDRETLGRYLP